jgi:hypothetical protein
MLFKTLGLSQQDAANKLLAICKKCVVLLGSTGPVVRHQARILGSASGATTPDPQK